MTLIEPKERRARGSYLGGHDISAIVGMHPYRTIGDVYAECALEEKNTLDASKGPLRRGRIIEPGLLREARQMDEVPIGKWREDVHVVDADVPFFAGTLDGALYRREMVDGGIATIYEVTTCTSRTLSLWGEPGTDDVAKYKWIQVQWYMGIVGAERARVFLFVTDRDELREYTVQRSGSAIEELRAEGERFWLDHVLTMRPPPPSAFGVIGDPLSTSELMDRLYRAAPDGKEIEPTPELVSAAHDYGEAREAMDAAEARKAAAATKMKSILEDATLAKWQGGRVSWTKNKATARVDNDALIAELAKRASLDAAGLAGLQKTFTAMREGPRVLRVTMTGSKE